MGTTTAKAWNTGRRLQVSCLLIVSVAAVPLACRIADPFVTPADANTAQFAQAARNHVRHGLAGTRGAQLLSMGAAPPAAAAVLTHHPPLVPMAAAAAFALFGVEEWTARLVPAACSAGSVVALFLLWRRVRGDGPALLAAAALATIPAFGHFGKMLGHEPPTLLLGLLAMLLYLRWRDRSAAGLPARLRGCAAVYAAGCLSGWAAFQAAPAVLLHAILSPGRSRLRWWRPAALLLGVAGACFLVTVAHLAWVTGSAGALLRAGWVRALASAADGARNAADSDLAGWLARQGEYFERTYGLDLLAPAGLGAAALLAAALRRRPGAAEALRTAAMLLLFGVAHPLVFRWAAFYHDWLQFHLLPIAAVAVAEGIWLAAAGGAALLSRAGAGLRPAAAAGTIVAVALLAHRGTAASRGLERLALDAPAYGAALIGPEIARRTPPGGSIAANVPFLAPALRFYADRPVLPAGTVERLEAARRHAALSLYARDLNVPIERGLEEALSRRPSTDAGSWRLYDLTAEEVPASGAPRGGGTASPAAAIDAVWMDGLGMSECTLELPEPGGGPSRGAEAFTAPGSARTLSRRLAGVRCAMEAEEGLPPLALLIRAWTPLPEGGARQLPLASVSDARAIELGGWRGRGPFTAAAVFVVDPRAPAGEYTISATVLKEGAVVIPVIPGPPRPRLKWVKAGSFVLDQEGRLSPSGPAGPTRPQPPARRRGRSGARPPADTPR
ncbi:MAG TPA: glycosyltransferase family 39 protein [Candidatus Polarisedimenticolia bacterium]|nr:glycosyltransferase family 39 protein [Candidatus Polarisedimenticolia bacterium]